MFKSSFRLTVIVAILFFLTIYYLLNRQKLIKVFNIGRTYNRNVYSINNMSTHFTHVFKIKFFFNIFF